MKLVFDVAGVLLHWDPLALLMRLLPEQAPDRAAAARVGATVFEAYGGDWGEFDRGRISEAELVPRIVARSGLSTPQVAAVVHAVPRELQPLHDTLAMVRRVQAAGHPVYFLSNMPLSYSAYLEQTYPWFAEFDDGVFSARVHHIKPEPAIYALAAERFGHAPADMVFFDDVAGNVAAARACGWNALVFTTAAQAEADLRQRGWWPEGA